MIWLAIPALAAAAYYLLAIVSAARWHGSTARPSADTRRRALILAFLLSFGRDAEISTSMVDP